MKQVFRSGYTTFLPLVGALLALMSCEQLQTQPQSTPEPPAEGGLKIEERDVEKPEIFTLRQMALWDGKPSFGGVWAALPDEVQPERVSITNMETGQSVMGSLFKREEQTPGPPIRVSSDAANALGIPPGQPTSVTVTVVRRETVASLPEPVTPEAPMEITPSDPDISAVSETVPEEADQAAVAPVAAIQGAPEPQIEETPLAPVVVAPVAAATEAVAPVATVVAQPDAERPRTLMDLFRRRDRAPQAAPVRTVEETPVITIQQDTDAEEQAAITTPAPATPVAEPQTASVTGGGFLQTGTFTSRVNAQAQVTRLDDAGVPAIIRQSQTNTGAPLFRVLAGPAGSSIVQDNYARTIYGLGITDAFPTSN